MANPWPRIRRALAALTVGLTLTATPVWGDGWGLLEQVQIREEDKNGRWYAFKTFPKALKAAASRFEITGYYVPVQAQPYVTDFLLVQDPADCPFCGGAGYGPTLEVQLRKPLGDMPEFTVLSLRGRLELIEDTTTWQAYRLRDAVVVKSGG